MTNFHFVLFRGTALIQSVSYFEYLNFKQRLRHMFCYSDVCEVRNWSFDSADHPRFFTTGMFMCRRAVSIFL